MLEEMAATFYADLRSRMESFFRDDGRRTGGQLSKGGGGHGLVGMRERAQMFGGTLDAGPVDGGFEVRAHLPAHRMAGVRR